MPAGTRPDPAFAGEPRRCGCDRRSCLSGTEERFAAGGARLIGSARWHATESTGRCRACSEDRAAADAGGHVVISESDRHQPSRELPAQRCIRLAQEHRVILVENDIYGDLRYEGDRVPTLKQMDTTGDTILLRSFSKTAFPGLRVGWMMLPAR